MAKRPQTLNFVNGYAMPGERSRAVPVSVSDLAPVPVPVPAPKRTTDLPMSTLPKFLEFDRKVRAFRIGNTGTTVC